MFDGRAFHSLAVVGRKKTTSECVGRVSNLTKLTVMFAWATIIVLDILILREVYDVMFHFM